LDATPESIARAIRVLAREVARRGLVQQHYTPEELGRIYQVTASTVAQWIRAGEFGPVLMVGRGYRVPTTGVMEFESRRQVQP
jgi:excisionase family DNA binding protein